MIKTFYVNTNCFSSTPNSSIMLYIRLHVGVMAAGVIELGMSCELGMSALVGDQISRRVSIPFCAMWNLLNYVVLHGSVHRQCQLHFKD